MWAHKPRTLLLSALFLDWLGCLLIFAGILYPSYSTLLNKPYHVFLDTNWVWFLFCFLLYPLFGWLFGSYTVLRWSRLGLLVLSQRLLISALVSFVVVSATYRLVDTVNDVWFLRDSVQFVWLSLLIVWSFLIRLALRRGFLLPIQPRLLLLASDEDTPVILQAWSRDHPRQRLEPILPDLLKPLLNNSSTPSLVALSTQNFREAGFTRLIEFLEIQDPRLVQTTSIIRLFEQLQERLPPALLSDSCISYDQLPWAAPFSAQAQLKRLSDLVVAVFLLLITAPFVLISALLIWLEDQGPVFYTQQRSGWLGRPFTLLKLRTMREQKVAGPALWTQPFDERITRVGHWLRRLRLDELPQLINVLNGDMSLIGPRPERPELEKQLEVHIPHYRKRHWMRPGLSGWAQVCAPYASSIDDSDLKLSYDLYYLRHFSTWLDLVILFRTIKTVLKAAGR